MQSGTFLGWLFGGLGAAVATPLGGAMERSDLIQESPVAVFQFHRGERPQVTISNLSDEAVPWQRVCKTVSLN